MRPLKLRLRFGLKTLLAAFLLIGTASGYLAMHLRDLRAEQEAIAQVHASKPFWQADLSTPGALRFLVFT